MIHDKVSDELDRAAQSSHVFPGSQTRIYLRVVDRIESGIRAVNGRKERQKVRPAENASQRSL